MGLVYPKPSACLRQAITALAAPAAQRWALTSPFHRPLQPASPPPVMPAGPRQALLGQAGFRGTPRRKSLMMWEPCPATQLPFPWPATESPGP